MPSIDQINQGGTIYEIVPEIAELFSTTKTYHTGDHVIYEAGWYTFKADKTAGAWDATKVNGPFKVSEQLTDLKEELNVVDATLGVYKKAGIATQVTTYTLTNILTGLTLEKGEKYQIKLDVDTAISLKIYGYLKDANGKNLLVTNIEANETSATYEYISGSALSNCSISFQAGVTNLTVKASIEKKNPKIGDFDSYEELLNLATHDGYINARGEISSQTADQEVYTDKQSVTLLEKIKYSLTYPTQKTRWINACVYYKDGSFERIALPDNFGVFDIAQSMDSIRFTYRTYGDCEFKAIAIGLNNAELNNDISGIKNKLQTSLNNSVVGNTPFRFKACYDHLFVSRSGQYVTIPHESVYHVRVSKTFGFNTIEANIAKTSDDVFIVNHLSDGKFGNYFHHIDGETDISNVAVSSVTWEWISANVRYNSTIPKYRTKPCRIEEFLSECRQQNIIPFITASNPDVVMLADKYMGKDNYIAYYGNRTYCPTAIIYEWLSLTTKDAILQRCETVGKPYIYGMGNPSAFTDEELKDIVDTLHTNGYWIGTSYVDSNWHKYSAMGFDLNGTQGRINRITNGNICNFDSLFGFDDYVYTNATETDGILTFTADGSLAPKVDDTTLSMCAIDIQIEFTGSITIPSIGEHIYSTEYTSDGSIPFFASIPIINGNPKLIIQVSGGTIIKDITFKASKF